MAFDFDGYLSRIKQIESSGNYNARNKGSGAWGAYQFVPSTAAKYSLAYGTASPAEQDAAARRFSQDNYNSLSRSLGRAPEPWELYMAHQQGAGGAASLLNGNPNAPLARNQLSNNPFGAQTAGQWLQGWQNKFNGTKGAQAPFAEAAGAYGLTSSAPAAGNLPDMGDMSAYAGNAGSPYGLGSLGALGGQAEPPPPAQEVPAAAPIDTGSAMMADKAKALQNYYGLKLAKGQA